MPSELQQCLDTLKDLSKAHSEFQEEHKKLKTQLDEKGKNDPIFQEKVDKINGEVGKLQEKVEQLNIALQRKERTNLELVTPENEKKFKRIQAYGQGDFARKIGLFKVDEKIGKPVPVAEKYAEYKALFHKYLCKGEDALTPEEKHAFVSTKGMITSNDVQGGYLVVPEMSELIIEVQFETSPFRQYMGNKVITSDALEFPSRLTLPAARWVGESQTRSETTAPTQGMQRIPAHEINADPQLSQRFLDDAFIDGERYIEEGVAEQFNITENAAFASGNGVARPRGFLSYDAGTGRDQIQQLASGDADDITDMDKVMDLVALLKQPYHDGANFFASRAGWTSIRKMVDGQGQYLWQPSTQVGKPAMLLGYAAIAAQDMPDPAANALSLAFGNFKKGYLIVDRLGMRVLRDPYTAKPFVILDFTKRVGGAVIITEAIKIMKCAESL